MVDKEAYFTGGTIYSKALELLAEVSPLRDRHAGLRFQPEVAALLVLDMQHYFLDEGSHAFIPSAPAIISGIAALVDAFRQVGRPVIYTRHVNVPEDAGMMARWWNDLIKPRSAHSQLALPVDPSHVTILEKTQYDAFHRTYLERTLRELKTEQVVICGVMTHLCCESTARAAFMHGFEVFFTVDGTATYNEALHRASMLTLSHGFAIPVLVDEILRLFEYDVSE